MTSLAEKLNSAQLPPENTFAGRIAALPDKDRQAVLEKLRDRTWSGRQLEKLFKGTEVQVTEYAIRRWRHNNLENDA